MELPQQRSLAEIAQLGLWSYYDKGAVAGFDMDTIIKRSRR
jgi:hypothetical protein